MRPVTSRAAVAAEHRREREVVSADARGYASLLVLNGVEPLRVVVHDHDGDWQFLCGTTDDAHLIVPVHADHIFARYPDIAHLRHLPRGNLAERDDAGALWALEPLVEGDD